MQGAGDATIESGSVEDGVSVTRPEDQGFRKYIGLVWIPCAIATALVLVPPGEDFRTRYAYGWYAVGVVLLSVIGRRRRLLAVIAQGLIGASALYIDWMWTVHLVRTNRGTDLPFVIGLTVVAALVAAQLITIWRTRRGIDPVFLVAVQLAVGQLTVWAEYVVTGLGVDPGSYGPVRWTSPFSVELPLLALALAAVGLGVQRSRRDAFGRLGLTGVSWWQALVAIAFAAFAPILNDAIYGATRALSPGVYASTIAVATAQGSTVPLAVQLVQSDVMPWVLPDTSSR